MSDAPRRIVLTGSESTGKTTLARQLATSRGTLWVPEWARAHAESRGHVLDESDVEPIARGQMRIEDDADARAREYGLREIVLDTDLVSTTVYARHYYGACPPWIDDEARARRGWLYLLCDIDLEWQPDAARDRPAARETIHAMFIDALERLGARYEVVRGLHDERFTAARDIIVRAERG